MGRGTVMAALWFLLAAAGGDPRYAAAVPGTQPPSVVITLFWGEGCPHCEKEKEFLRDLVKSHPTVTVREIEVWKNRENAARYKQLLKAARITQGGVPGTLVGSTVYLGFNQRTREDILQAVKRCLQEECTDAMGPAGGAGLSTGDGGGQLVLPLLGTVDPGQVPLPFFTIVIAGLDSFNPCAFFVLLFLLSLLVHARSRTRMALIGGLFVLASGGIYFLFMAAWLTVFQILGGLTVITLAGGCVALLVGAINVKDFFLFKRGVSLVIPESAKPRLFERMRGLLRAESLLAMLTGTAVLAVTANAYELLCTAGFPMIYTRVLTLHGLTSAQYYRYLVLYNVVYVVPLAVIVALVTITLGARKLTEWQGRQLKLVSGLMMTALGIVLILKPALLNNVLASGALLTGVAVLTAAIIAVTKRTRPRMSG